ncbi:MAG: hypothetical protein O3A00_10355 [Planctomycetota bacterium]|nr:hypothetical protein [Planctomycetota bacterium]
MLSKLSLSSLGDFNEFVIETITDLRCIASRFTPTGVMSFAVITLFTLSQASAQNVDTPDYFRQNCMNCHTIGGGRLAGPDLKDLSTRQSDPEWLIRFMQNPRAVVESGDGYAAKRVDDTPGRAIMPTPPNMTRYRAEQLIKLIEEESAKEKSQFQGVRISNEPFTAKDVDEGRNIFVGRQKLANGGTACINCHDMHDLSALGGGHLGPDLTQVYSRLHTRKAISAWLMAPATENMQPIFKNHPLEADEIHALVAYFASTAKEPAANASVSRIAFLLSGLGLATALIFLADTLWKRRLHAVRKPLVEAGSRGKQQ